MLTAGRRPSQLEENTDGQPLNKSKLGVFNGKKITVAGKGEVNYKYRESCQETWKTLVALTRSLGFLSRMMAIGGF